MLGGGGGQKRREGRGGKTKLGRPRQEGHSQILPQRKKRKEGRVVDT